MDVDGVLTDGRLINVPGARRKDGRDQSLRFAGRHRAAMALLARHSYRRDQRTRFARHRGARPPGQDDATSIRATSKRSRSLRRFEPRAAFRRTQIAYAGDDLTDVVVMRRVGLAIATANARAEVKRAAHYVTAAAGGRGRDSRSRRAAPSGPGPLGGYPEEIRGGIIVAQQNRN